MTNTSVAMRAAILLCAVFAACDGPGAPNGDATSDAGPEISVDGHDTPDAPSARPDTTDAGRAQVPPPPDVCGPFDIRYAGVDRGDCPTINCACPAFFSGPLMNTARSCVQSVDCSVACGSPEQYLLCGIYGCTSDLGCAGLDAGKCLVLPGATEGLCAAAADLGSNQCVSDGDCSSGERCIAVKADGTRGCVDPTSNDRGPCNHDADCPAERCAFEGSGFLGVCTAGAVFAPCFSDGDCASGLRCRNSGGDVRGACSDGADGAPCERDADCQVGVCAESVCSARREPT